MRTIRSAAAMVGAATSVEAIQPILEAFGFVGPIEPLDTATRAALGVPPACRDVGILRGPGALRALVLVAPDHLSVREAAARIATRLASTAPHILWMLAVMDSAFARVAIAACSADRKPPRIVALVIERARVVDSDGETLCALAAAQGQIDALVHARWLDILGRESITRRFYRALERLVAELAESLPSHASLEDRSELALLCTSRLLFLSFLEAKGWLDGDRGFLARSFDECSASGGSYHRRVLLPLLHGTLNTRQSARSAAARAFGRVPFLNGGLFARTPVERRHRALLFPDATLGELFGNLLARYRFTAREDSATWSEAAVDPEMLGRAFESIMASRERRGSGAYYTPQALVERVTRSALAPALRHAGFPRAVVTRLLHDVGAPLSPSAELRERLSRLRVVDPACGSGAFLVHALERIAGMHATLGDTRDIVEIRRSVLTRTIFGVDRNPFAVWLCELRLWLSMVIESTSDDPRMVPPLPNLDHHIRVGDALAGEGLTPLGVSRGPEPSSRAGGGLAIARLRTRYVRATGPRKQSLARALDRAERMRAKALLGAAIAANDARRRDLLAAVRSPDLFGHRRTAAGDTKILHALRIRGRELRGARRAAEAGTLPFSFPTHFADAASAGGFDVVVGNPPWVRLHRIPRETRVALKARFAVFREPGWDRGMAVAHAGAGFAAQIDLAALFVERAIELLRPGGTFSLLLPSKLWHSLAGSALRRLLLTHAAPVELEDLAESPHTFDAAVYPSMLTAVRHSENAAHPDQRRISATSPHVQDHEVTLRGRPATRVAGDRPARDVVVRDLPIPVDGNADRAAPAGSRSPALDAAVHRRGRPIRWAMDVDQLGLERDPASPWLVMPPEVRIAFDCLTAAGTSLADSVFGRPYLGVKCGCNAAFIVIAHDVDDARADHRGDAPSALVDATVEIEAPGRRARIERELLRPLIRGESLRPWRADNATNAESILWPHDAGGTALQALPPLARHWLLPWRRRLLARTDARGQGRWWTLFRTESARNDVPRVVWPDIGKSPRAAVLDAGDRTVALNSCYVVRCPTPDDAHAFAALLNGPLATAWLNAVAEPARGGFRRYLGWTTALLPIPLDWARARSVLAPLGERGHAGEPVAAPELLAAALTAYGVTESDAEPLITWMG